MPEIVAVLLLGFIEGLTEFLPVSSTGHLLIAEHWLPRQTEVFNVVIQAGAVLAVLAVFQRRVVELLTQWREPAVRDYLFKLFIAFAVTGAGGLALKKAGFTLPHELGPIAWATLVGGVAILAIEWFQKPGDQVRVIPWVTVVAIALAQLLAAAFPGTSRSGATILMGMAFGLRRPAATEFSFLLGVPTIWAASAWELLHAMRHHEAHESWGMLGLGTLASAATAFVVVRWLVRYVQTHSFVVFGWYRILLGGLLVWAAHRGW